MNASSSMDKTRAEEGDDLLLPPKQTEWRRYSKTLIEELKEKLEDRRAKTLALLSENKDLSAFQEIDTESDGLDDTSTTNATSKHDDERRSANQELGCEQALVVSSQSEASSLTESDCCPRRGYCASSADAAGCEGVCTHSSYSMTSSTDDEGQSESVRLTPPRQDSVVTMTSLGGRWQPGEENLQSIPYMDLCEEEVGTKFAGVNNSVCTLGYASTAYMVRRSSSHCCLNSSSPVITQNFNVRLSRSYTYLFQDADYDLQFETTSAKVSCFAELVRLDPVPMKAQDLTTVNVVWNAASAKELTDIDQVGSIGDKPVSPEIKMALGNAIIAVSGDSQLEESLVTSSNGHVASTLSAGVKRKIGGPQQDFCEKYGDSLNESEKKCAAESKLLNRPEGRLDTEQSNKQCGDMEAHVKPLESSAECFNSTYIGRVTSELDYLQSKLMLEEICDVIKSSIAEDVDKRLIRDLKEKIDQCSVSLNVSSNSGYVTSQCENGGRKGEKEEPCTPPVTDPCGSQLKKCLEKAHLASLLQKEMGHAKSNIATIAAKRAYEKAIGDFDSIVNDYLKADTSKDGSHDEQNKVDIVASFRRSETFIIDKDVSLHQSPMPKQLTSSYLHYDTKAQTILKPGKYTDPSADNVADIQGAPSGKYENDMPPRSSPTYFVSQKTPEASSGKRKKKKSDRGRDKMGQFLTGNKMQDTNAFVVKHFGSGTQADSESDSSDSFSYTGDTRPFKYTSSMLAQLLDYDSQDEKVVGKAEHLEMVFKHNEQSSDSKGCERSKHMANSDLLSSILAADINAESESPTRDLFVENVEENLEEVDQLTREANEDYDSDFNAGSISECIQEEERSCDEDNDAGLCFNTGDKKDVDSATFNVDRQMDSKDGSDMELNLNEETAAVKESSNIPSEVYEYSEDFDVRDETNDVVEQNNAVDIKRCNESSCNSDNDVQEKLDIVKDVSVAKIPDSKVACDLTNYITEIDEIKGEESPPIPVAECSGKDGNSEGLTSFIDISDVCHSATVGISAEAVSTCTGTFGACCSKTERTLFDQTSIKKFKKTSDKLDESIRPQFIPMVEWSSSDEDIFEDLTRDKSPSDILRQKQKEMVDEKLKQLTQMSKRRRKSRSPVSYKIPKNSVNLDTLLEGNNKDENRDFKVGSKHTTNTSLRCVQKHLFAVLTSPEETHREPECAQPSVSDLFLSRLNEEEFNNSTSGERTLEQNETQVLQTRENTCDNALQISKPSILKGLVSPSKMTGTQEPTMRASSFTAQSPTKSTMGSNQRSVHKEISCQIASTDPASSVSSTSGEYNLPDSVHMPQKESRVKTRPEGLPPKCNNSKFENVSSGAYGVFVNSLPLSRQTGHSIKNANVIEYEMVPRDTKLLSTRPGCLAKCVDNVVREVKIEEPVTSQCGAVPILTAVTEGGPSVMCAKENTHEDQRLEQHDETALKQLKDCLLNDGSFSSPIQSFKTSAPSQPAVCFQSNFLCVHEDASKELHCSEDEGYPLYPTPASQPGSPYNNMDVDVVGADDFQWGMDECRDHREGTAGEWMFLGEATNFKQCVGTTRSLKIDGECVFKVVNPEYDPLKKSPAKQNGHARPIGEQGSSRHFYKTTENSEIASCPSEIKEFKNPSCSSNVMESSNTNQEAILEYQSSRNDILMSLLEKITLLESHVGQSQKSEVPRNPQAPTFMDPISFFLSGQREIAMGQSSHSRLSSNAPVLCPCRLHDCATGGFQGCCDHCGVCGRRSVARCQGIAHAEVLVPAVRDTDIAFKASQTEAANYVSQRAARTQSVSTQWQKQGVVSEGSGAGTKQTRQIGCQVEFNQEKCQCMQQCISSIEHLEGIERKLHGEVANLIKSFKRDTEEMVSVGYDKMASLLTAQLNEAASRSQQSVSTLMTTYNQSLTRQISDVTRCIGNIQCIKETPVDNKGQTAKLGMDYDTLKMRVVELTSQRDAEKVFHKITRESLRALERDHDRLRQEYVRATYRRLNHNSESEVRHRVYSLLNEPDDDYRCCHKHDRGHHSKYTTRGPMEERVKKPCPCEEEPCSRNSSRPLHLSETCKEIAKGRHDSQTELLVSSEKIRSKSHRKEKRGVHSSKQRVALLEKDLLCAFKEDAVSGNYESCEHELVRENSLCCLVDLRPTRSTAEDALTSQKSSGHNRVYLESSTNKTDGANKYENRKEENSSTGERRRGAMESVGHIKLPSTFSKDEVDDFGKAQISPTSSEVYSWAKIKADPPVTDSKCSLALSNESF